MYLMGTINPRDLEASFSFRSHKLNTTLEIFSDDDDSFIEIDLQPKPESQEFEFRISFSSRSVSELSTLIPSDELFDKILPLQNFQSTVRDSPGVSDIEVPSSEEIKRTGMFQGVNWKVKIYFISLWNSRRSSEIGRENEHLEKNRRFIGKLKNWELIGLRKSWKMAATFNDGLMKFLIKFPSEKIRSAFKSLGKSYRPFYRGSVKENNNKRTQEAIQMYRKLTKPFYKWVVQRTSNRSSNSNRNNYYNYNSSYGFTNEMNLETNRKVLKAGNPSIDYKEKGLKSDPSSFKSSPVEGVFHEKMSVFERDKSVSAAVAHCKRSFGEAANYLW